MSTTAIEFQRRSQKKYFDTRHRSWRVRAVQLQPGGPGNFSLNTLQMFGMIGSGVDLCTGGTPFATTVFDGTTPASNAFDGNDATLWSTTTSDGVRAIGYDFGTPVLINSYRIVSRSDFTGANPLTLYFESSDTAGNTGPWTTQFRHTVMSAWTAGEARTFNRPSFNDISTRWRFLCTQNFAASQFWSFSELAVHQWQGDTVNMATATTLSADSTFDGTVPVTNLLDGNNANWWTSGNGVNMPHWLKLTLASPARIQEWIMRTRPDAASTLAAAILILQSSSDDKVWVDHKQSGYPTAPASTDQLFLYETPFAYLPE